MVDFKLIRFWFLRSHQDSLQANIFNTRDQHCFLVSFLITTSKHVFPIKSLLLLKQLRFSMVVPISDCEFMENSLGLDVPRAADER